MRKRRHIEVFSISFLDLLSGALGAVIILYVALPKGQSKESPPKGDSVKEILKQDLARSQSREEKLVQEINELKQKLAAVSMGQLKESPRDTSSQVLDLDVGFNFKGKNIVFIIDTSFSMTEENRIGQVQAGLKMLLSSLPTGYKIDVVQFPFAERAPFRSMWGNIRDFEGFARTDAFDFIYSLRPVGGTPTREALMFVINNYDNLSDIVLLTDGYPTLHNSNKKDDIYEILQLMREKNLNNIQINTIGVGSKFVQDKASEEYKFLSLLASENKGFFVGF